MKKFVLLTILFAAFFVPSCAKAVDMEGFYVGVTGAADFLSNAGFSRSYGSYGYSRNRLKFDTGFFGAIDLGYRWCNGLHLEAEVAYRYNRQKRRHSDYSDVLVASSGRHRGHRDVWAAMVNVLYDINMCWSIEPYVGVGLGYSHVRYKRNDLFYGEFTRRRHFSDNDFAWQVIAGVAYPVMCNVDVAVEYRFFNAVNSRKHQRNTYNNDIGVNLKYYF